ncbi:MAG: hypothetical protein M1823_004085, partial [Watsoniomyces obsoletus]
MHLQNIIVLFTSLAALAIALPQKKYDLPGNPEELEMLEQQAELPELKQRAANAYIDHIIRSLDVQNKKATAALNPVADIAGVVARAFGGKKTNNSPTYVTPNKDPQFVAPINDLKQTVADYSTALFYDCAKKIKAEI